MNMSEDKLQLLRFEYQLLSPMCLPKVWPKKVKAGLGTRKLVHREKAEKVSVKTLLKVSLKAQKGLGAWGSGRRMNSRGLGESHRRLKVILPVIQSINGL